MELFKKLIISLFPDTLFDTSSALNPANMFISFINARQFFSVVHRRVVEHYKLNFFDTALDPFEIKIGFGDGHTIKPRDIEPYFAYCCVANINGHMMTTPVFQSTIISFVCAFRFRQAFEGLSHYYYYALIMTVHHLSMIFIAKIKQFPAGSDQERYQRFVELFFSTYEFVLSLHYKNYSKAKTKELRKQLLIEISTFFMLFYWFQRAQDMMILGNSSIEDFHLRLFQDEYQKNPTKNLLEGRLAGYADSVHQPSLSAVEKEVANIILPGDMQAKHLLGGKDIHLTARTILGELFDTPEIDGYMTSFLESGQRFNDFLLHISQFSYLRQKFFGGMKKYLNQNNEQYPGEGDDEGDELISFIGSMIDIEQLIPESIKQESKSIERLINFFITLVGGMRVARGDGGYIRTHKPALLQTLLNQFEGIGGNKPSAQYYYGLMLYNYSKNVFYYTFTYNHIRSGNDQFVIPSTTDLKEIPSNYFILSMLDQHAIAGAFQEMSPTYTKIYLKQTYILEYFKTNYSKKVGRLLQHSETGDLISAIYEPIFRHLSEIPTIGDIISAHVNEEDISRIKDSLYRLDYRIVSDFLNLWYDRHGSLGQIFTDVVTLSIVATLKDTLLGVYLFYAYIQTLETKQQVDYHKHTLLQALAGDLYNLSERDIGAFWEVLHHQAESMIPLMTKRIKTDDNKQFLQVGADNWIDFIEGKTTQQITTDIVGEDIMRLRGYLKNITYYNRRYLISSM